MNERHDPECTLPWMRQGTERFLDAVDLMADDSLEEPSRLPDWSCGHVVGHVARNAEALVRLATWARTGVDLLRFGGCLLIPPPSWIAHWRHSTP